MMCILSRSLLVWPVVLGACVVSEATSVVIPPPAVDLPLTASGTKQTAVIAGGCFWGIEAVFEHVRGVTLSMSGYAGGDASTANYEAVSSGRSGHAEAVQVTFDASELTYGQVLHIFFSVAHDPTELNRQGPDVGPQYRSAIFFASADQERVARAYIQQLNGTGAFRRKIVTEIVRLARFFPAEDDHQDYAARHPDDPYIRINDAPKVVALARTFPQLYVKR
jgi:peptide-methionine (S)-S-oxide reductase